MRWDRQKPQIVRTRYGLFCLLAFALAFFTKQSYVTGIAAVTCFLIFGGRWRETLYFVVAELFLILVPSAMLNLCTHGAYFKNTVTANTVEYSLRLFFMSLAYYTYPRRACLLFLFSAFFVLSRFFRRKAGIFEFYFLFSLAPLAALGANGSGDNYFIESVTASSVLFGVFLSRAADFNKRFRVSVGLWTLFCCQLLIYFPSGVFVHSFESPIKSLEKQFDPVAAIVRQVSGDVLAEDAGILIGSGKRVVYEPFEYTQLARRGLWDERAILDRLERKDFRLIVLNTNLFGTQKQLIQTSKFSAGFIRCLKANYKLYGFANGFFFLVPSNWPDFSKSV
jgi:hypothetical protein